MLNITQFRALIKSCLNDLLLYSQDAEELLVFTCAAESLGGTYLYQVNGPALGIYQMEPVTYNDLWHNFILLDNKLSLRFFNNFDVTRMPTEERIIYDLRYATAMTRIFYLRIQEQLPSLNDIDAIWEYYKKYYNTRLGKSQKNASVKNYHDFVQHHH